MYVYAYYIHTLYYIHTVDTYITAVCINVCMITFNVCIIALECFEWYARAATLITDRLRIDLTLIIDSCY